MAGSVTVPAPAKAATSHSGSWLAELSYTRFSTLVVLQIQFRNVASRYGDIFFHDDIEHTARIKFFSTTTKKVFLAHHQVGFWRGGGGDEHSLDE